MSKGEIQKEYHLIEEGLVDYSVINSLVNNSKIFVSIIDSVLNDPADKISGNNLFVESVEITTKNVNTVYLLRILGQKDWDVLYCGTIE